MHILSGLLIFVFLVACQTPSKRPPILEQSGDRKLSLPQSINKETQSQLLNKKYFTISYNYKALVPNWVTYNLYEKNLRNKVAKRRNHFFADPSLMGVYSLLAKPTSYAKTGYQRGHMAPSEDFVWSQDANDETFVMTNMAPQKPALNQKGWKYLEDKVRRWACAEGEVRVVTGSILDANYQRLPSQVAIPQKFYKVILDETPPRKALGFIYSQEDGSAQATEKVVSVAAIEAASGYRFFMDLSQGERDKIKAHSDLKEWHEVNCVGKRK